MENKLTLDEKATLEDLLSKEIKFSEEMAIENLRCARIYEDSIRDIKSIINKLNLEQQHGK